METNDLLRRVRRIEIKTRALSQNIFAGEYHSAYKGRGMSFSEVREYQAGDDVRDIDWNVTARFNRPYVKVYEEERELTVMLLIDLSESLAFATTTAMARQMVTEIAATLAFSALQNNDKIGAILFTDRIEKFIPPKKGRHHILYIIREMLGFKPEGKGTDVTLALQYLMNTQHKRSTVFLISDFLDATDFKRPLQVCSRKHDVAAIQVYDRFMADLPRVGLLKVVDAESDREMYLDTNSKRVREAHRQYWQQGQARLSDATLKSKVDLVSIPTDGNYVTSLINLFARR